MWCACGQAHWGRFGAAGLLLVRLERRPSARAAATAGSVDPRGGTWALPGGAVDSHEDATGAAIREAHEEAGITVARDDVKDLFLDDHGTWSYATVIAHTALAARRRPDAGERRDRRPAVGAGHRRGDVSAAPGVRLVVARPVGADPGHVGVNTLPAPCLVVLVGPVASGKSTWARQTFAPEQIVSSDALRAVVGDSPHDLAASTDAFAVLDDIVARRMRRRLTTAVDTLGLDAAMRARWRQLAAAHHVPAVAVVFDTPAAECRRRNASREARVPDATVSAQLRRWPAARDEVRAEAWDAVLEPDPVAVVPAALAATARRRPAPVGATPVAAGEPAATGTMRGRADALDVRLAGRTRDLRRVARAGGRRGRPGRRGARVVDGPPPPDPAARRGVARPAGPVHDARLDRRPHGAGAARRARDAGLPASAGAARQGDRHPRRGVGRAGDVRAGGRVVRRRIRRRRDRLPRARRTLRRPRGRARRAAGVLGQGGAGVRRAGARRRRGAVVPAAAAGPRADLGRRRRRAAHAGAHGPPRRRRQPAGSGRRGRPQGRRAAPALPRRRSRSGRAHRLAPLHRTRRARPGRGGGPRRAPATAPVERRALRRRGTTPARSTTTPPTPPASPPPASTR